MILAAAALAATAVYLPQQRLARTLRAEADQLAARASQLTKDREDALKEARLARIELEGLQVDRTELARLREETGQLRKERDSLRQRLAQPSVPTPAAQPIPHAGAYLPREKLGFAGYATPEAALVTMTWAMMSGDYEQSLLSLGPELRLQELANDVGPVEFEARRQATAPFFKGMQILASKVLADDIVELKVRIDATPGTADATSLPSVVIQPMVKVGNDWKVGTAERDYEGGWDESSQPEPLN